METSHSKDRLVTPSGISSELQDCGSHVVNGHRLYWERYGDLQDPIVLLLHHGLGSIRSWRRQIPTFVKARWQVLLYDRWGYGRSDERPSFEDAYLARDTEEAFGLIDALGVERLALLGHSDGGTIALIMAAEQPARISAMVVVAAHIYIEPKMAGGLKYIAESTAEAALLAALKREHGERAPALVRAWVAHWLATDPRALSLRDRLPAVSCPTLVVQGELDEHATAQHAVDIADGVQNGQLWLVPHVKHMPPHEIPEIFNQRVLEFLSESSA